MKKILLIGILIGLFTGCFGGVKTTSKEYKKELLEKIYNEDDMEAKVEYKKIIAELEEAANNGKDGANEELEKWEEVKFDIIGDKITKMSKESEEAANKFLNKKGKGW